MQNYKYLNLKLSLAICMQLALYLGLLSFSGVLLAESLELNQAAELAELEALDIESIETELNEMGDSIDLLSTIETDSDIASQISDPEKLVKAKKAKLEIKPQHCFTNILKEKPLHYAVCGDGRTILDKNTGLMWDRCSYGKTWNSRLQACEGKAKVYNWQEALQLVESENKNNYLSKKDWRLPNIKELASIVETACTNPAIDAFTFPESYKVEQDDDKEESPTNKIPLKADYWTSSVYELYPQRAWYIDFDLGHDNATDKRSYKQLRLVRLGSHNDSYNLAIKNNSNQTEACVTYPAISFSNVINVPTLSKINSSELEVVFSGVQNLPISIEDGEYMLNDSGLWTDKIGQVKNNDRVKVRHTSAPNFTSDRVTTLKVGEQYAVFRSTTLKATSKAFNDYLSDGRLGFNDGLQDGKGFNDDLFDIAVNFEYDSALLLDTGKQKISKYIESIREKFSNINSIQLLGYTDAIASEQYNKNLSVNRAISVFELLRSIEGLEKVKINYIGKGKSDPIATNETEEGRAKNRRVTVFILYNDATSE